MPRIPGSARGTSVYGGSTTPSMGPLSPGRQMYQNSSGPVWRHTYQAGASYTTATLIEIGKYALMPLAYFRRTFGSPTADVPPTPINYTNNYATPACFNGSRLDKFQGKITLKNESANQLYLDVCMIAVSFYDALVWNTVWAAASPINFVNTLGAVDGGHITQKAIGLGFMDMTTIRDSTFIKRFVTYMGTITVPAVNAGGIAEININQIPAKCRRVNQGMYWGLAFCNDGLKNNGDVSCRIVGNFDFLEYPAASRNTQYPG